MSGQYSRGESLGGGDRCTLAIVIAGLAGGLAFGAILYALGLLDSSGSTARSAIACWSAPASWDWPVSPAGSCTGDSERRGRSRTTSPIRSRASRWGLRSDWSSGSSEWSSCSPVASPLRVHPTGSVRPLAEPARIARLRRLRWNAVSDREYSTRTVSRADDRRRGRTFCRVMYPPLGRVGPLQSTSRTVSNRYVRLVIVCGSWAAGSTR